MDEKSQIAASLINAAAILTSARINAAISNAERSTEKPVLSHTDVDLAMNHFVKTVVEEFNRVKEAIA